MKNKIILTILVGVMLLPSVVFSAMSSTNYRIDADSLEVGGALSSGGSFRLEDTIGGLGGTVTSTSYQVRGGFHGSSGSILSLTLSSASIALGTLSATQVTSGSAVVTVATDSDSGYTLSVASVSGTGLTGVTDGSVSSGSEEYGFAASGADSQFSGEVAVAAGRIISSSSTPVGGGSDTTLTFKASVSSASVQSSYSQTVSLAAVANF